MKNEVYKIDNKQNNEILPRINGLLHLHNVEELDNIILELNNGKISLDEFICKVWNTAYTLGQKDGCHCNNR